MKPSPLVLIDCEKLSDRTDDTVLVPLIRFTKSGPVCICEDPLSALSGVPCPIHQPEEFAVFGEASR